MARYLTSTETLHNQLGELVTTWSILENNLAVLNAGMLGAPYPEKIPIFYAVLGNRVRGDLLKKSALSMTMSKDEKIKFDKLVARFLRLNTKRNKYIHGMYGQSREDDIGIKIIDFTSPSSTETSLSLGAKSKVGQSDITNHIKAVTKLTDDVRSFCKKELGIL